MSKLINYLIRFALISTIPVVLEIYIKGPELFFGNIMGSVLTIILYYFISCFIFNVINAACFYVFGKSNDLATSFLNLFPIFIRRDSLFISYNILSTFKLSNTYELFGDNIEEYIQKVGRSIRKQLIFKIVLATFLLGIGVYFKVSICNFIFAIICLYYIVNDYCDSPEYLTFNKNNSMVFDELVFSRSVDKSILEQHEDYLYENMEDLQSKPDLLNDLVKLVFSCYNLNYDTSDCILRLDGIIENLLISPSETMDIPCRGLVFDYIDNRICLDLMERKSLGDIKFLLNMYISKSWDINIPKPYLKRYKVLSEYLNNYNSEIRFRTGYMLLYLNNGK